MKKNKQYPFFSICIPNYNYGHFIEETINSVLKQSYRSFEIIISDNKSTDNSMEIINRFKSDRISVYQNKYNVGFSKNLDCATIKAQGEYIILLSADDLLKGNALEYFHEIITSHNQKDDDLVIFGSGEVIDRDGNFINYVSSKPQVLIDDLIKNENYNYIDDSKTLESYNGLRLIRILLKKNFVSAGPFLATCYSKKLYKKVSGYSNIMSVFPDAHFSHKLCLQDPKLIYSQIKLFSYREHDPEHKQHGDGLVNKQLIDLYHISNSFNEEELENAGLNRLDLQKAFIEYSCLSKAKYCLFRGEINQSIKHFIFGFISYKRIMFKYLLTYLMVVFYLFIPFFAVLGTFYKKNNNIQNVE
tara:strand:+ start:1515 stop:2591 length:1077 start_codon:yes stop_codon:yes gene_type:complete